MSNFLSHTQCGPNSVVETKTDQRDGDSQLYRWECEALGFKFEAWISYQGDYALAVSEMRRRLIEAIVKSEGKVYMTTYRGQKIYQVDGGFAVRVSSVLFGSVNEAKDLLDSMAEGAFTDENE